jgi:hypothetical protein
MPFSGFYFPDTTVGHGAEYFASAWMTSKEKFIASRVGVAGIINFEGTVFAILGTHWDIGDHKKTLLTRDWFDFQVEHLSSTTNVLTSNNYDLYPFIMERLNTRAAMFQRMHDNTNSRSAQVNTVALIPFSVHGATTKGEETKKMRISMFLVTFWSLKRYNFAVAVSVSSEAEQATLMELRLPLHHVYKFYNLENAWEQPKKMLLQAIDDIQSNPSWSHFKYVYYSDADQILQMRNIPNLFGMFDMDPNYVLCPHRFQTMVLPKDAPAFAQNDKFYNAPELVERCVV